MEEVYFNLDCTGENCIFYSKRERGYGYCTAKFKHVKQYNDNKTQQDESAGTYLPRIVQNAD